MPFNDDRQDVDEDQQSDAGSLRFSESMASLSDYEHSSRQSFMSDSSSKSSSPASTSPPRVITFDEVMATAKNLTNLSLAHEIAVNENFRLEEDAIPENSLAGQMRRIVHQAFWDVLKAELSAEPPEYEHAIRLFEEIRESLLSFLTPGGRSQLYNQICEVLDIDLLRQQAEHSAVDIQGLANYVISTMGKMCAPVRDQVIRDLKATDDIVELLRQIFHVLDLMKMDQVNFAIRNIRPHIQRQLVEYERSKFQEILEETPDALKQTTEWLKESIDEELLNSETAVSPGAEASSPPSLSPMLILHNSFLKLLQWDYQKKGLPETLITDEIRLQELTEKLNQLKIIACLSLITNNMVGAITEGLPELANRLKRISAVLLEGMNKVTFNLKEALNSIGVQTCVEINEALKERGSPPLNTEVQANLVGQFSSIEEKDNPVRSLIDKRIQLYMKSLLCLPSPQKSMPPMPGGLDVIQQELEVLGCQYANIVILNKQIYGSFYASIFRKLLFGDEGLGKVDASLPAK